MARPTRFAPLPADVMPQLSQLSRSALLLYLALATHFVEHCYRASARIPDTLLRWKTGLSRAGLKRARKELVFARLVQVIPGRATRPCEYELVYPVPAVDKQRSCPQGGLTHEPTQGSPRSPSRAHPRAHPSLPYLSTPTRQETTRPATAPRARKRAVENPAKRR